MEEPVLNREDFEFRVGTSLLTEFAIGHTGADVLRELVQNEYDAGGTSLQVEFGRDALTVTGNGDTIDAKGWKRLTVMLGTGTVAGEGEEIRAKVNGIGSKNFGLRSLFLFGDRIVVASGGRYTVLDRMAGALPEPRAHPASSDQSGVTIRVPFRAIDDGRLRAFDERHEREVLHSISSALAPTLIKLVLPGLERSVRRVVVRSVRLGCELAWHPSVRQLSKGVNALKRRVRLEQAGDFFAELPESISETEYRRTLSIPEEHRDRDIPAYFRAGRGRIRIGISFRNKRSRIDLSSVGLLYYPLGATRSRTGFPFSINAPLEMNEDRSQAIDAANSDWNAWLISEAARFAVELLKSELFTLHGADAFLAVAPTHVATATIPGFATAIDAALRNEPSWPSQAVGRKRRPQFCQIQSLIVASSASLAAFTSQHIDAQELLHPELASVPQVRTLALALGAKEFTLNSLVRLRCAGANARGLATKLSGNESVRFFTAFPDALQDLALQERFCQALDASTAQLSEAHRADLATSPTTLTAAGTLDAPKAPLWLVDRSLAGVVPPSVQLHPELSGSRALARLCSRFNASSWVLKTLEQIVTKSVTDESREALLRYIRGGPVLTNAVWAALNRAPILRDHRGEWARPAELLPRGVPGAQLLAPVLRFAHDEDIENGALKHLRFSREVPSSALVALAKLVEAGAVAPSVMRDALVQLLKLVTPTVAHQLRRVSFLETASGSLVSPDSAYQRHEKVVTVLGEHAAYPVGLPDRVVARLQCRASPSASDIVAELRRLEAIGDPLQRPDAVYRALHDALRSEKRAPNAHRNDPIIWTGTSWTPPAACLVGVEHRSIFQDLGVPVLHGPLAETYRALGAFSKPEPVHWVRFFEWVGARYGRGLPVPERVGEALVRAYLRLEQLPEGIPTATPCFLDDSGCLRTRSEAEQGRLVINDDPALASAARAAGASISFAYVPDPRVRTFFRAAGVRRLSEVAKLARSCVGAEVEPDEALSVDAELRRIREQHFASALSALSSTICRPDKIRSEQRLFARLRKLERIVFVETLDMEYRVAGKKLSVSADHELLPDRIYLARVTSDDEFRRSLARAIADTAFPPPAFKQEMSDAVYFLLRCRSTADLERELRRRGIPWQPHPKFTWSEEEQTPEEEATLLGAVGRMVTRNALARGRASDASPMAQLPVRRERGPLPHLTLVTAQQLEDVAIVARSPSGGYIGPVSNWVPRSEREREEDAELGRRGEEIVFQRERERVAALGFSPDRVIWTADANAAADHDIQSVDDDGETLWIEVKATAGRDGRFAWPSAEFRLAVRERKRYVLYRVYEAHTLTPKFVTIRDPIGRFQAGAIQLNLDSLVGDVGRLPKAAT